jgi:hypothetical protein
MEGLEGEWGGRLFLFYCSERPCSIGCFIVVGCANAYSRQRETDTDSESLEALCLC